MILKPYDEVFHNGVGSPPTRISIEKQRANAPNNEMPPEVLLEELRNTLKSNGFVVNGGSASKVNLMATPANSGMLHVYACIDFKIYFLPNDIMHLCMMLQVMK